MQKKEIIAKNNQWFLLKNIAQEINCEIILYQHQILEQNCKEYINN